VGTNTQTASFSYPAVLKEFFVAEPSNRDANRFIIRMPEGLRDRIRVAAERNNRSMNAEIVGTLEAFYPKRMALSDIKNYIRDLTESYRYSPSEEVLAEIGNMIELLPEKLPQQDNLAYRAMNEDPETDDWNREHPDQPSGGSLAASKLNAKRKVDLGD
jgi:hypothetical protein